MAFKIFQCVLMPSRCFTVNNVVRSDISNGKIPQHVANGKNSTDSAYGENILFSSDHHSFILLWFCFSKLLYCFLKRNKNREKKKTKEFSNKYKQKSQTDIPGIWLIVLQGKEKHYYIY